MASDPSMNASAAAAERSIDIQTQSPATTDLKNSSMPHIKWQAGLETAEESGFKCLLCKRDLAYTPQGPVRIPATPPQVAVLSCGHTFHDLCLLDITPRDQPENPPCFPCILGEEF